MHRQRRASERRQDLVSLAIVLGSTESFLSTTNDIFSGAAAVVLIISTSKWAKISAFGMVQRQK